MAAVRHHITDVKCVSGCPKIILGAGLGLGCETPVSWPECSTGSNPLDFFFVGMFENQGLCQYIKYLERTCGLKLNNFQVK
jgi:hypothetical protein